jgi:hypothetical protein
MVSEFLWAGATESFVEQEAFYLACIRWLSVHGEHIPKQILSLHILRQNHVHQSVTQTAFWSRTEHWHNNEKHCKDQNLLWSLTTDGI